MSLGAILLLLGTYSLGGLVWGDEVLVNSGPTDSKLTLGDIRNLPPREAGDKLLGEMKHGPVATVRNFNLPSTTRPVEMLESPTRVAEGCQRLRWIAVFRTEPSGAAATAWLSHIRAHREVAMAKANGCEGVQFVRLPPEMDRETGFKFLAMLSEIAAGTRKVSFDCKSPAGRKICDTPEAIKAELARPVPVQVIRNKDGVQFTYLAKTPGWEPGPSLYMTVRFDPERLRRVTVMDMRVGDAPPSPPIYDAPPPPVIVIN